MTKNPAPKNWWKESVIYELYVDKFANNFKGLTANLDYFTFLGINTLWLLPHYPSPMVDGGYDVSDYTSVRSDLGDMKDFDNFIGEAHDKNIRVIVDFVLNHTSIEHPWFIDAASSRNSTKRDWYLWSENANKHSQAFVHFPEVKNGSNWIKNKTTGDFYYATFYPEQPDLNWDNEQVYEAMLDAARFWLDRGVDGFRLDAVSRLVKRENTNCFALPETHNILKRMRSDLQIDYPQAVFIAESGGWTWEAKGFFGDGDECQIVINFPLASHLLAAISDGDMSGVEQVWDDSKGIGDESRWGIFLTNHDSVDLFFLNNDDKKNKLTLDGKLSAKFGQNNSSSFASRLFEICGGNKEKILWATKKLLSLPGVPILYYGNEIGMPNANLPQHPTDNREYVRGDFDWETVKLQKNDPESILNIVKEMINARQKHGLTR
jgi:maltose alpha-D-glucosyltransferase / alpha-amylase